MSSHWRWALSRLSRRLWARATLIGLLGIVAALVAVFAAPIIPDTLTVRIGAESVGSILNVLASSMLAVTTFSLSVTTSAYSAASNGTTPRATKLLIEDSTTQNALATFIGSFLFSIVGLIVLHAGGYAATGRFVLFLVTIVVIALIVISLLRWIDHLTRLGRVGATTKEVEDAAYEALLARQHNPYLGGQALDPQKDIPAGATPLVSHTIGYIQHIDIGMLNAVAERYDAEIYLTTMPGAFAYPYTILAWSRASAQDIVIPDALLHKAFSILDERNFDQDPRFGVIVLGEIASRALSAAINDPGTAIDVIGRIIRLLALWSEGPKADGEIKYPRLHVPALRTIDLLEDGIAPFARYGASAVEVQVRLQKGLYALSHLGDEEFRTAIKSYAALCLEAVKAASLEEAGYLRIQRAYEGKELHLLPPKAM